MDLMARHCWGHLCARNIYAYIAFADLRAEPAESYETQDSCELLIFVGSGQLVELVLSRPGVMSAIEEECPVRMHWEQLTQLLGDHFGTLSIPDEVEIRFGRTDLSRELLEETTYGKDRWQARLYRDRVGVVHSLKIAPT